MTIRIRYGCVWTVTATAGVVIGICDSGIDIFHKNFQKPGGGSRILAIWDQTLTATAPQGPPPGYTLGTLFTPADIASALAHPDQPFAHRDTAKHGTHVAGIAAGNASQAGNCHGAGRFWGVAPDADLVIVKVLRPDAVTAESLARFQREAQALASLNHPNIAHIYGLEEANGIRALVLELVEGPTLADRITQGPISLDRRCRLRVRSPRRSKPPTSKASSTAI